MLVVSSVRIVTDNVSVRVGFENINVDLISAIPKQTISMWEESLRKIIALNPEHISAYSLMFLGGVLKQVDLSKMHTKYVGIILSTVMLLIMNKIGRVELSKIHHKILYILYK